MGRYFQINKYFFSHFRCPLTITMIFCPEDEESAEVITNYIRKAFPMVTILNNLENMYDYEPVTNWQRIFEAEPCLFIVLMTNAFLEFSSNNYGMSISVWERVVSMDKTPVSLLYLEEVEIDEKVHRCFSFSKKLVLNLQENFAYQLADFHKDLKGKLISSLHDAIDKQRIDCC